MRTAITPLPMCVAALLLGCGGGDVSDAAAAQGPSSPPARVRLARADAEGLREAYLFSGEVRAARWADLAPDVSGAVREVRVRVGDRVEAGALLFTVDPRVARDDLAAARAVVESIEVEAAQAEREAASLGRATTEAVAALEVDRAEARAAALGRTRVAREAELRRARTQLRHHRVRAPFAGQVAEVRLDPGDWAAAGQVAIVLVDDSAIEVHVGVDPELLPDLERDARVTLRFGDGEARAEVAAVVRSLDPVTGSLLTRLVAVERPPWLLPGRWVDVRIEVPREGGVRVPRDALVRTPGGVRVVTVADGVAALVDVSVQATNATHALVMPLAEGALAPGMPVVIRGNERLRPGQPVISDEPSDAAGEAAAP